MKLKLFFTSLFLLTVSNPSQANFFYDSKEITDCKQKHKSPMDYSLCLDAAYVRVERELMTWETNVEIKLTELNKQESGNDPVLLYKASVRYFNKYKKAICKSQYVAMLPDLTSAVALAKECEIYISKDRIEKLKEFSEISF